MNQREAGYALLRVTLGTIYATAGCVKLGIGVGNFTAAVQQQFAGKLPVLLVVPFAYTLPLIEVVVGVLLVLGLFNVPALISSGLLMLALTFSKTVENDPAAQRRR